MKQQNIILFLLLIAFVLIIIGTGMGWYALQDQVNEVQALQKEQIFARNRLAMFKRDLVRVESQLTNTTHDFKSLVIDLRSIEQSLNESRIENKEISSQIEELTAKLDSAQLVYNQIISRLSNIGKAALAYQEETFNEQMEIGEGALGQVELGEISVEKPASQEAQ